MPGRLSRTIHLHGIAEENSERMVIRIIAAVVRRKEDRTRINTEIGGLKVPHLSARIGEGVEALIVLMCWVNHPDMNGGTRKKS